MNRAGEFDWDNSLRALENVFLTVCGALFFLFVIGFYVISAILRNRQERKKSNSTGYCRKCQYCLRGNVSGICPECGTPIIDA